MPESQFFRAAQLKRLVAFLAIAILAMVVLGPRMPDEPTRLGFIVGWMIVLPVGCWLAIRDRSGASGRD